MQQLFSLDGTIPPLQILPQLLLLTDMGSLVSSITIASYGSAGQANTITTYESQKKQILIAFLINPQLVKSMILKSLKCYLEIRLHNINTVNFNFGDVFHTFFNQSFSRHALDSSFCGSLFSPSSC